MRSFSNLKLFIIYKKAYSSVVERTAHNGLVASSNLAKPKIYSHTLYGKKPFKKLQIN